MKRSVSLFLLLLPIALLSSAQHVSAQSGSQSSAAVVMEEFVESISGKCVSFDYSYTLSGTSGKMTGSGHVVFQGDSFRQEGNGLETWCDGISKWTVDRNAKEAVVETVDTSSPDYLSYPTFILRDIDKVFSIDTASGNDGSLKLRPSVRMGKISSALLEFAKGTYRPAVLELYLEDGTVLKLSVSGYEVTSSADAGTFSFDAGSLGEGYVITDLR